MLTRLAAWLLLGAAALTSHPGTASSPLAPAAAPRTGNATPWRAEAPLAPTASYRLVARLDAQRHQVSGQGTIEWTNRSDSPVDELYFHLYLNAFRSGSLFEKLGGSRDGPLRGRHGRIDVQRLSSQSLGSDNLWDNAEPAALSNEASSALASRSSISPAISSDHTDYRVPLPRMVEPGEKLLLDIEFVSVLPEVSIRTGYAGDYHLIAQWFPKLARLESNGTWAHFQFHPRGEFYADFGDYEVTLDVPSNFVVGSTGDLRAAAPSSVPPEAPLPPSRKRYTSRAPGVIDFAWTAWPRFATSSRTVLSQVAGSEESPSAPEGIRVQLLTPPGSRRARDAHWSTLETALPYLSQLLGPYPHSTLTVVEPPAMGAGSHGMEYPSFFTTDGSENLALLGVRAAELTTVHELTHQWFQGLVATNEHRYPFLDEGLTSYIEWRYLEDTYGSGGLVQNIFGSVSRLAVGRFQALGQADGTERARPRHRALASPVWEFSSFPSLARHVYHRPALTLETLARVYGRQKVHAALGDYARSFAGRHPKPHHLYAALQRHLGPTVPVRRLFEQPVFVNARIVSVKTRAAPRVGSLPSSYLSTVEFHRSGVRLPTNICLIEEDGRSVCHPLPDVAAGSLTIAHRSPAQRVVVDPKQRVLLDENLFDNRQYLTRPPARRRARAVATSLTQALLSASLP